MRELVKAWCVPGTVSSAIVILVAALPLLAARQTRSLGLTLLVAGSLCTALLALPVVSRTVAAPLSIDGPAPAGGAEAIVVLAGDNPEPRIADAARLYRRFQPRWVIASGAGDWADELTARGVPAASIIVESRSRNTREQAEFVKSMLASRGIGRVFLVASILQIRRATAAFRAVGCDVTPVAAPVSYGVRYRGFWRFVPQRAALALGRDATYEYGAWAYYRWRGWLAAEAN